MSTFVTIDHQEAVQCPRCGSLNVHAEKRGWSFATGMIGKNKILLTCLKCSKEFYPAIPRRPVWQIILILIGLLAFGLITGAGRSHGAESTAQRDAPTVRFYTPDGKNAGSASTYGNTTKFYAPDGKLTGSATRDRTR